MAITPNELRIGNLVNTAVGICIVEEIPLKSNPLYSPKALHPIPLSKEWLLKFGAEVEECKSYSLGYEMPYKVYRLGNLTYNGIQAQWWYAGHTLVKQPESVHELQNLYFALTGTELIVPSGSAKV